MKTQYRTATVLHRTRWINLDSPIRGNDSAETISCDEGATVLHRIETDKWDNEEHAGFERPTARSCGDLSGP